MSLINCENLFLSYEGKEILSDLSFTVEDGDYICVVGENGSGKSSLIKTILGLKQPKSGKISFGAGIKLKDIGYLPQQTPIQKDFPAGVWEVILSGCLNRQGFSPFYTRAQKQKAAEVMASLHIEDLKNECYRDLSGGQQQRVLLARALCATTHILLLDEPVTGLDPIVTDEFYDLIRHINKDMGITVIMVSHDLHFALRNADMILHLDNEQVFFGSTDDYLQSDAAKAFLGGEIHV